MSPFECQNQSAPDVRWDALLRLVKWDPWEGRSVCGVDGAFFQYGGASEVRHAKKGGVMLRDPTVHLFLRIIRLLVRRKSAVASSSSVMRRTIPSSRLNGVNIGGR